MSLQAVPLQRLQRTWTVRIFRETPIVESAMGITLAAFLNDLEKEGLDIQHVTQSYDPNLRSYTYTVFCAKAVRAP